MLLFVFCFAEVIWVFIQEPLALGVLQSLVAVVGPILNQLFRMVRWATEALTTMASCMLFRTTSWIRGNPTLDSHMTNHGIYPLIHHSRNWRIHGDECVNITNPLHWPPYEWTLTLLNFPWLCRLSTIIKFQTFGNKYILYVFLFHKCI